MTSMATVTSAEAAVILGVTPARIRQLIHERKLKCAGYEKVKGKVRVTVYEDEIKKFAETYRQHESSRRWIW